MDCIEKLRNLRREKNYTQDFIADYLKISQKAYSDIENGKRTLKREHIMSLAEILDIHPDELCFVSAQCQIRHQSKNQELVRLLRYHNIDVPEHLL